MVRRFNIRTIAFDNQPEHLQRGGIGPVHVFPRHLHGLPFGLFDQQGHEQVVGLLSLPLRTEVERRILLHRRERSSNAANGEARPCRPAGSASARVALAVSWRRAIPRLVRPAAADLQ